MKVDGYFDLSDFEYKEIFTGVSNVWEVVPKIEGFIVDWLAKIPKRGRIKGEVHESAVIGKNVYVEVDGKIGPHVNIAGPAIVGKGCLIDHGAYLRPNVIVGKDCRIGHASEVKNSILLNRAKVPHFNYVGDSVIGSNVMLGGGAKLANLRFDEKSVLLKNMEERVDTGLTKFGAIIGDGTKVGVNAVFNPGTVLGKKCKVYPGVVVSGTHGDKSAVK